LEIRKQQQSKKKKTKEEPLEGSVESRLCAGFRLSVGATPFAPAHPAVAYNAELRKLFA
jgi:hypothetical protein